MLATREVTVTLRLLHPFQQAIRDSLAKRRIVRAGRRSGKTVVAAQMCVERFLAGRRCLYATPTADQLDTWWYEVKKALAEPIDIGAFRKNEMEHSIERAGTQNRLRGKTAYNADTLRGDFADFLILDEYQLMNEDTWGRVGAPMLLDNNGDALFIYTPPSLLSRSLSKARDPHHAAKLFSQAQGNTTGRWATFSFSSLDNPYISAEALRDITQDMTQLAYRQEILAEDILESPDALWTRELLEQTRVTVYPTLSRIVVGVDPPGGVTECGIIVAGLATVGGKLHAYILDDRSLQSTPDKWAAEVLLAVSRHKADCVVGEANYGGDMVQATIQTAAKARNEVIRYKDAHATRGKAVRAEPVVALFEQGRAHMVGNFPFLEDELCQWVPGETRHSPNRLDAMVWAVTELRLGQSMGIISGESKTNPWRD